MGVTLCHGYLPFIFFAIQFIMSVRTPPPKELWNIWTETTFAASHGGYIPFTLGELNRRSLSGQISGTPWEDQQLEYFLVDMAGPPLEECIGTPQTHQKLSHQRYDLVSIHTLHLFGLSSLIIYLLFHLFLIVFTVLFYFHVYFSLPVDILQSYLVSSTLNAFCSLTSRGVIAL